MPLSPGERLGAYEIVCPLGAGGMGEVYRARDTRLGREVAVKVLPADFAAEPRRLERFNREARVIAALNHPHIVTIYSTEEHEGIRFITMELVDGCTLADLIGPNGMSIAEFMHIALPLADALCAAHQKQITHRDLKPGNVMVSSDNRVKVLDFGLAHVGSVDGVEQTVTVERPLTQNGAIVGTVPYMSPEQLEGRPLDARSDLFSVGVVFYEMLCGARPFSGSSSAGLMSSILKDIPPPIHERRSGIPDVLDQLIGRLLEKQPEDRVQTARDVYNELRRAQKRLDGGGTRPTSPLSVAVLPFVSRSADDDAKAMAEGLTDDISSGLSRFGYIRVLSQGMAARHARDGNLQMHARFAIEGNVRRAGPQIRVSVTIVNTDTGTNVWNRVYDGDAAGGIFAVQDDLASAIIATLGTPTGILMHAMEALIADKPTEQLSVSELVVRFHAYGQNPMPAPHLQLREAFELALEKEPHSAEAWACLSILCQHEHGYRFNPRPDSLVRHRRAAERATAIDPQSQQAWVAMVSVHFVARDLAALKAAVDRVVRINRLNSDMIALATLFLSLAGEYDRVEELIQLARRYKVDQQGWYHHPMYNMYFGRGDYEAALRECKAVNMMNPFPHISAAAVAGLLGRADECRPALAALRHLAPELLNPAVARMFWATWLWQDTMVDRHVEGLVKALELADVQPDLPPR
jgi:serine/threonine protein kinase